MKNQYPKFTVDKTVFPPRVYLHCSECDVKIREIKHNEKVMVTRAYYCEKCYDGTIRLNTPRSGGQN